MEIPWESVAKEGPWYTLALAIILKSPSIIKVVLDHRHAEQEGKRKLKIKMEKLMIDLQAKKDK